MPCEIEFMPVGAASKPGDAIIVRYGTPQRYELMVIDGGTIESGENVVKHLRKYFGNDASLSHALLSHGDGDHASGLRPILREIPTQHLWMHVPWIHAQDAMPLFANKGWAQAGLETAIKKEYDVLSELLDIAAERQIPVFEPYQGDTIGPFHVLSPTKPFYTALLPQFDRTPAPDQAAIQRLGFWIGKPPNFLANIFEKVIATVEKKWVEESWQNERLKNGGVTSAANESSVVLYSAIGERILLTADAGNRALTLVADYAEGAGFLLKQFNFVQVPHHGSRRNVGPTILNRLIGPIRNEGPWTFLAFVSAPPDDDTHPRQMVVNAFMRRGARVLSTKGKNIIHYGGFLGRPDYVNAEALAFASRIEDYD
jgi:beta-lactamase superfamily II metal-dependent hydrolase